MSLRHKNNYKRGKPVTKKEGDLMDILKELPENQLKRAVSQIKFLDCPECGKEMFYEPTAGHNSKEDCRHCGKTYKIVG